MPDDPNFGPNLGPVPAPMPNWGGWGAPGQSPGSLFPNWAGGGPISGNLPPGGQATGVTFGGNNDSTSNGPDWGLSLGGGVGEQPEIPNLLLGGFDRQGRGRGSGAGGWTGGFGSNNPLPAYNPNTMGPLASNFSNLQLPSMGGPNSFLYF